MKALTRRIKRKPEAESDELASASRQTVPLNPPSEFNTGLDLAGTIGNQALLIGWMWYDDYNGDIQFLHPVTREPYEINVIQVQREDILAHIKKTSKTKIGFLVSIDLERVQKFDNTKVIVVTSRLETHYDLIPIFKNLNTNTILKTLSAIKDDAKNQFVGKLFGQEESTLDLDPTALVNSMGANELNFFVEAFINLNRKGFFIYGWADDYNCPIKGIYIEYEGVISKNILPQLSRKKRADVHKAFPQIPASYHSGFFGFVGLVNRQSSKPQSNSADIIVIDEKNNTMTRTLNIEHARKNVIGITEKILSNWDINASNYQQVMRHHIQPALEILWEQRLQLPPSVRSITIGNPPEKPEISLIIPLYGRCDFVLHHMAHFSGDEDFSKTEVVYVLDDPALEDQLVHLCRENATLFNASFKILIPESNLGFANANNLGVRESSAPLLILMNSDVIPVKQGWINALQTIYNTLENPGILGVKLIYDDHSIQHIGMECKYDTHYKVYLNDHPFKGLPESLAPHAGLKESLTVTAACAVMSRDKFTQVDGFDPSYLLGDFEDSDLCFKMISAGYKNYITDEVTLYHLERQS